MREDNQNLFSNPSTNKMKQILLIFTLSVLTVNRFKTCVNEKKFEILTGHKIFYFQNAYLDIEYNKFEQTYGDREHFCDASQLKV